MNQTRIDSFMEAVTNTLIGFCVTLLFSPIIYHAVGVKITNGQQAHAVFWFTILSVIRSYVLRRIFKNKPVWATIKTSVVKLWLSSARPKIVSLFRRE